MEILRDTVPSGNELAQGLGADQVKSMGIPLSDKTIEPNLIKNTEIFLKPCPFCGNTEIVAWGTEDTEWFQCNKCGAGTDVLTYEPNIDKSVMWNMRVSNSDYEKLYMELIMAVAQKFPNESRHETALRYIREREQKAYEGGPVMANPCQCGIEHKGDCCGANDSMLDKH